MYKKLKPTVIRPSSRVSDYAVHADIFESEIENQIIQQPQRFPVWATKHNLIVEDEDCDGTEWQEGWNLDEKGPEKIVKGFSNVKVKSDFKLIGYRYIEGGNGNGFVWAIPKSIISPKVNECEALEEYFLCPPKPRVALENYMLVIEGDKSPFSYLQAAILNHELGEYGATWHGVSWGGDSILPWSEEIIKKLGENTYQWDMKEEEPEIIEPHFYFNEEEEPVVVFYTINDIGIVTFNEYKHIFNKENYTMKVERKILGTAGWGIVF